MDGKDAKGSAFDEVRKMLRGGLTSKLAKKFTPEGAGPEKKPAAIVVSISKPEEGESDFEGTPAEESHETPEEEKLEADAASTAPDLKTLISEHLSSLLPKRKKG